MIAVVLSLTACVVPSLTRESSYRKPKQDLSHCSGTAIQAPNNANKESFGFLLTHAAEARAVDKFRALERYQGSAFTRETPTPRRKS